MNPLGLWRPTLGIYFIAPSGLWVQLCSGRYIFFNIIISVIYLLYLEIILGLHFTLTYLIYF